MTRLSSLRFMDVDRTRMPVRRRIRPRGVPNALSGHPVAVTSDLDQACAVTSGLLGPATIHVPERPGRSFTCSLYAVQCLDVTLAYLDYGQASELSVTSSQECFTVHMTTSGQASVEVDGEAYLLSPFFALVASPGTVYRMRLEDDSPQMIVRIERDAMERELSHLLGRSLHEPIRFQLVGDLTSEAASRWTGALNILSAEVMAERSLIQQGIGGGALEELLISTLLYVQPSNYSDLLSGRSHTSGRPAVRRSVDYIEQHLAEPIRLADLAAYAKMSPRSIQAGFREDLETTPVAYIRDRRLEQVRRTLMAATPEDGLSVTEAAQRWGFPHLGSFSVLYRKRFGESPSQTLRR